MKSTTELKDGGGAGKMALPFSLPYTNQISPELNQLSLLEIKVQLGEKQVMRLFRIVSISFPPQLMH